MKKSLKITLIVVGSILLLLFVATLLVSPIATAYINKNGKDLIGRTIQVDNVSVNVYTGHLEVLNLKVLEDDDKSVFVSFDTLDVKARLLKLLASNVYLDHITLAGLNVNVIQNGEDFNFNSIIDFFASDEEEVEEEDTTASDWKISLYNINLSRGRVYYADKGINTDWDLEDINIKIPGFVIGGNESTDAGITLQMADGGTLNTQVNYDINTNDFTAMVKLNDFAISNIKAYLTDMMRIGRFDGILDADITAKGNLDRIEQLAILGNAHLKDVDIRSNTNQPVIALRSLNLDNANIYLDKELYDIGSITIDGLSSRYDLYANDDNFSRFLIDEEPSPADTAAAAPDTASAEESEMEVHLRHFSLTNSQFTYADHTLPDRFEFPITNITINANNLSLSGTNAATIKASLPHGGSAFIDWSGNLDDLYSFQRLKLDIKNLQMADISPYTVAYLGWPFEDGTFSFLSLNTIRHSQLDGQNHLDIYKATVGKKRKDVDAEINIPLKAALYVLKDKDEKIQFDVPISGNIESPDFNYMKLVWKTLGNLLVKVATEPFRLAGDALGISSKDEQFIPVDPAQQELSSEQYYMLERYASAMNSVPGLKINLQQQLDAASDSTTLQLAEKRNAQVVAHLTQQMHVPAAQISTEISLIDKLKKPGYFITGKIEEDQQ
ncbi:MAG: DUF748 domain-containing protein [Bacteroidales bacterium]|nr:DUF748 domain-containing protein [Bacteroidales bacterium]